MFLPIRTDYRIKNIPWVNYGIIALNVGLFVMGYNDSHPDKIAPYLLDPDLPQLPQFVTSVFLHSGWLHLIGNMIFLWVFGNAVNDKFGHLGYLMFYLAGGILAGVGYLLLAGDAPILGASGAIAAVTGVYLVLLPRAKVTLLLFWYYITYFDVSSLLFIAFQVAYNLWMSLVPGFGSGGGIAYAAHSSGYAFGVVVAMLLLGLQILPRDALDLLNLFRSARRRMAYRTIVAKGYDPFNPIRPSLKAPQDARPTIEPVSPDSPAAREFQLRREIAEACGRNDVPGATVRYLELLTVIGDAILPRQQQLDIANQLMADQQYAQAADAYERFLVRYPNDHAALDICLMLGLAYGRYLREYDRAEQYLRRCQQAMTDPRKRALAEAVLEEVLRNKKA